MTSQGNLRIFIKYGDIVEDSQNNKSRIGISEKPITTMTVGTHCLRLQLKLKLRVSHRRHSQGVLFCKKP